MNKTQKIKSCFLNLSITKKVIPVILIMFFCINSFCQNSYDNHLNQQKYWYYRDRLKYFIVPGSEKGESMVAGIRNRFAQCNIYSLDYGQHAIYFGYYLSVLATEYYLLKYYNQNYTETVDEIELALNAYIEQMDKCEESFYNKPDTIDGFFIREDVMCDLNFVNLHSAFLNKNLTSQDSWENFKDGRPGYVNNVYCCVNEEKTRVPMSQDEAIGLLKGLALVYRCFDDIYSIKNKSKEIALSIIDKIYNNGDWHIIDPIQHNISDSLGSSEYTTSYAYSMCAAYFGGNPFKYFPSTTESQAMQYVWNLAQVFTPGGAMNASMTISLATICDCWSADLIEPVFGSYLNSTGLGIRTVGDHRDWDSFYIMFLEFLQNKRTCYLNKDKAKEQLSLAPCAGPFCWQANSIYSDYGWAGTYKFENEKSVQNKGESDFEGVYNGLDYMLLYNLYHITELRDYSDNKRSPILMPVYENKINVKHLNKIYPCAYQCDLNFVLYGSDIYPYKEVAFSSIESNVKIDNICHLLSCQNLQNIQNFNYLNHTGNVVYRAGERIVLSPGFTVKSGANFHAYIKPLQCESCEYKNSIQSYNYGSDSEFDSLTAKYYSSRYHDDFQPNKPEGTYKNDSVIITSDDNCKIFPNPFTDKFNLEYSLKGSSEIKLSLVSESGTKLKEIIKHQSTLGTYSETIDCSELAPGVYNCLIKTNDYTKSIKILKTR